MNAASNAPAINQAVTVSARSASASTRVSTRNSTPRMRVMASRKEFSSAARRGSRSAKLQSVPPAAPPRT
jgi:hypothetical protein